VLLTPTSPMEVLPPELSYSNAGSCEAANGSTGGGCGADSTGGASSAGASVKIASSNVSSCAGGTGGSPSPTGIESFSPHLGQSTSRPACLSCTRNFCLQPEHRISIGTTVLPKYVERPSGSEMILHCLQCLEHHLRIVKPTPGCKRLAAFGTSICSCGKLLLFFRIAVIRGVVSSDIDAASHFLFHQAESCFEAIDLLLEHG